ncbi:uncharacterized [Tachysurus ichikawai]
MQEPEQVMPGEVKLAPPSRSAYCEWSGSRQSDRLPPEMTPVTERSAANLQASFCLNSLSPCCQILIFSVTARHIWYVDDRATAMVCRSQ